MKLLLRYLASAALIAAASISGCNQPDFPPPPSHGHWVVFNTTNSPLLDNHIHNLVTALDGTVWIATDSGASSFKWNNWGYLKDSLTYRQFGALEDSRRVTAIAQAKDRSLWFCLYGGGVTRYSPFDQEHIFLRFRSPDLISDFVLSAAAETSPQTTFGEIWFATTHGISRFVQTTDYQGRWYSYSKSDSGLHVPELPADNTLTAVRKPDEVSIWFGTESGIVSVAYGYSGLVWTPYPMPSNGVRILSIAFDLAQTVWIGRQTRGVYALSLSKGTWTLYGTQVSGGRLPDGPVNTICTDLLRKRWFGTESGLVELNDTAWTRFTAFDTPLPSDTINTLTYDYLGNLWIGTDNGIAVYNDRGVSF